MATTVNIWLDDLRSCPDGWLHFKSARMCIAALDLMLSSGNTVGVLSLDHDLGACKLCNANHDGFDIPTHCVHNGTGYDVVCWLEEKVANDLTCNIPAEIRVHSDNPVGRKRMELGINSLLNMRCRQ